ncbi:disintegrin and metalloproteinase domain-containing protein 32-like [Marmota marmota marmota]|uniref:disintegrin and metalloproteinase domain-containing protein 32-like n=1 Tax=Marmota marmota marmota TaxID=9994 RepID=UPI002093619E|nr:disintegrin and metalloproteinase domain-containing protein 32-like [Marmota marmota marmota]
MLREISQLFIAVTQVPDNNNLEKEKLGFITSKIESKISQLHSSGPDVCNSQGVCNCSDGYLPPDCQTSARSAFMTVKSEEMK